MTLLELASARVCLRKVGSEYHGPCPSCGHGPKSTPQTSDRFTVKPDSGIFFCRTCTPDGGGAVKFLMKFDGKSCPEAHAALGQPCDSATCPATRCPQRNRDGVAPTPAVKKPLLPPKQETAQAFVPTRATAPADLWREQAEKLVARAHAALLDCPEQLAYLAARGIPREEILESRLGWLAEDNYRPRSAWGLPEELRTGTTTPKKLWLPMGLVIPFFCDQGHPDRLRIRRHQIREGEARYYWVPGSGDDVPVLGRDRRAFVIVESDLDAFLVRHHAGDLVGAIPLGTCSAKPKESATAALRSALSILVATDYEPRTNAATGQHENPGGQSAQWWLKTFPRAKRLPTPAGKDPGEYFKDHGGDIRAWILAALPPIFRLPSPGTGEVPPTATAPNIAVDPHTSPSSPESPTSQVAPAPTTGRIWHGHTPAGQPLHIAERVEDALRLASEHPGEAVFLESEILAIKNEGYTPELAAPILLFRANFPFDGSPLQLNPVEGSGLLPARTPYTPPQRRTK